MVYVILSAQPPDSMTSFARKLWYGRCNLHTFNAMIGERYKNAVICERYKNAVICERYKNAVIWLVRDTLMRQSDWCDLHTQMQQSDRRKIHTQMRRSDRCELHTILHANIEWFFYIKKTSKTQEKSFVQNLTVVNEISTYNSGSANVMVYSSAPNMEITYWKLVIFLRVFDPFVCLPLWVNHQRPAIIDNNKAIVFSHRRTVSSALLASSFNSARRWFIHSPSANKFLHDIHSQIWLFFYVQLVLCAKEKQASLLQN